MRKFATWLMAVLVCTGIGTGIAGPAHATVTPLKVTVFQGNLDSWVSAAGSAAVVANLSQADILVISHVTSHTEGTGWANIPGGSQGCSDTANTTLPSVLAGVKSSHSSELIFGYVSAAADAPDVTGPPPAQAHCGNCVNNIVSYNPCSLQYPDPSYTNPTTTFTSCPAGLCLNSVQWIDEWLSSSSPVHTYLDGIFVDYVAQTQISATVRDNIYSYVHTYPGKLVMANSLTPGSPCSSCPGIVDNYQFAADSSQLGNNDYILVEGYYRAAGADSSVATANIASVRNSMATKWSVRPRIAALVTQNQNGPPSSIACTDTDYLNAHTTFDGSSVTGDAIGYEFSDYGTLPTSGAPVHPLIHCS